MSWLRANPILAGTLGGSLLYLAITLPVDFTFMADDWVHLAESRTGGVDFASRFELSRVPVWSVIAWAVFRSGVYETTWAPMYFFFGCHALGFGLIVRWLLQELPVPDADQRPVTIAAATGVLLLYPNYFEVLYWPTAMVSVTGVAFMGLALWVRPWPARAALLCAAFLTYETYVLPSAALLAAPILADVAGIRAAPRAAVRPLLRALLPWAVAILITVAVRAAVAAATVGAMAQLDIGLAHALSQMRLAVRQLFLLQFFGTAPNWWATALFLLVWAAAFLFVGRADRKRGAVLIALAFLSTATYWLLGYSGIRAIYGAQVLLMASLAWLIAGVSLPKLGDGRALAALLLLGFYGQSASIFAVKSHNAAALAELEAGLARQIQACPPDGCRVTHDPLEANLRRDWLLHPHYQDAYLKWVAAKHGHGKRIDFVQSPRVPHRHPQP